MRAEGAFDEERNAKVASEAGAKGVVVQHEGVGDPFTYRKRSGRFSASEWAVQIVLPVLVVLLGARALPDPKNPNLVSWSGPAASARPSGPSRSYCPCLSCCSVRTPRLTLKALNPRFCEPSGRFGASEWAVQIVLPVLVVLLGARTPPYPKSPEP